ncbi:ABC transporter ATP-binding protein [Tepidibacter aestuarii]|uniref:ABC transporter ATP-binding protein n=1 Tax=Tepidibacter aestuarii TaxID=2925782 RepID=UPI0020BE8E1D|nr:ABC transporter ATP-binding protein [Tepidibacter aestuarii]CAH2214577.1 Spermidine/putrescine import ATP-binding protein PotA [Tepidibacter aestuarii]
MSYLNIKDVEKSFGDLKVLKKTSLNIEKGKLITLLGPSGSGKSTLLRSIAGLESIDSGSIIVDGEDITSKEPKDRDVGMVFQQYVLFPNMTVYDNIAFGLKLKKMDKKTIDKKVKEVLSLVELSDKANSYPHQLSGGQQQRVALARSIILEPKILLFDEPLSALDRKIRKNLQVQIKKIQRELDITSVFVTHDQEEAMIISDEIYLMNNGEIEQKGSPQELYNNPKTSFVAKFIGTYNVFSKDVFEQYFKKNINAEEVAIRPEVIQISKDDISNEEYNLKDCTVADVSVIGNTIRYEVIKNGFSINVDVINDDLQDIKLGEKVNIFVPKKKCIFFEK